ncbi:tRNA (adenosine(37)-N6)-threonylcarbamoyltransferase complex ATPase subunit type 1 TsaE [Treponema zioleckii]|uniref:tRNA (adenosine(37)-N6)-threonylcarbamoyltransferase complex ATPase subunit type 1 TsaE n=1 Tax=Treponema zioleckii TaxID=331680 RepID=UPI00168AA9A3|nr:tRNA (adenosine(37)-N6)-threonylcarbamoyltransferase complex ATPase subunit type 1 TsaE [Treponema zioleckii]
MCLKDLKTLNFHTKSAEETIELGKKIGNMLRGGEIIAMQGTLAAGKTTITKGIASALGVKDTITSPTFCLISEYEGKIPLYHMDVYRLDSGEDFINLGVEDIIYGKGVSIIEWSEKVMEELPRETIILKLEPIESTTERNITITNWPYDEFSI